MPLDRIRTVTRRVDSVTRALTNRIVQLVKKGQMDGLNQWEKDELGHLDETLKPTIDALTIAWNEVLELIRPFPGEDPDSTPPPLK